MREPAFIETMTRFRQEDGSQFRFWAKIPALNAGRQELVDAIVDGFLALPHKEHRTSDDLAMELLQFHPNITAVEVVDHHGNGVVLYSEWPERKRGPQRSRNLSPKRSGRVGARVYPTKSQGTSSERLPGRLRK